MHSRCYEGLQFTTKAIVVLGSYSRVLYRSYGEPTQFMVLVVEGMIGEEKSATGYFGS